MKNGSGGASRVKDDILRHLTDPAWQVDRKSGEASVPCTDLALPTQHTLPAYRYLMKCSQGGNYNGEPKTELLAISRSVWSARHSRAFGPCTPGTHKARECGALQARYTGAGAGVPKPG